MKLNVFVAAMAIGLPPAHPHRTPSRQNRFHHRHVSLYADIDGPAGGDQVGSQDFGGKVLAQH
jgi:hypothetical protein